MLRLLAVLTMILVPSQLFGCGGDDHCNDKPYDNGCPCDRDHHSDCKSGHCELSAYTGYVCVDKGDSNNAAQNQPSTNHTNMSMDSEIDRVQAARQMLGKSHMHQSERLLQGESGNGTFLKSTLGCGPKLGPINLGCTCADKCCQKGHNPPIHVNCAVIHDSCAIACCGQPEISHVGVCK